MAQNTMNEEMMKRILYNQRMIMDQNQKILQQQEEAKQEERERGRLARDKVPLIVKVNFVISLF